MKCPKCGFENSDNSKFCINCAANLINSDKKICPNCKTENLSIAKFCYNCAANLVIDIPFEQKTSIYSDNSREENLRKEIERLKSKDYYSNKKKSNKKWIIISIVLLLIVFLPTSYFIWFRSFQTQTQKSVQEVSQNASGGGLQVISMTDDGNKYYIVMKNTLSSNSITISSISITPGGSSTISSNNKTLPPSTSGTFIIYPNFKLATGKARTFTTSAYDNYGNSYVTATTYMDS